jgi:hypothetical protein
LFFGDDRAIRAKVVGTPGKVPKDPRYSVAFSIMAAGNSGLMFKLLLPDEASAAEFSLAIANFLGFLSCYYSGRLDSATQLRLASSHAVGRTILMMYDKANGFFEFPEVTASEES